MYTPISTVCQATGPLPPCTTRRSQAGTTASANTRSNAYNIATIDAYDLDRFVDNRRIYGVVWAIYVDCEQVMNSFAAKDIMAYFPDYPELGQL